MQSKGNTKMAKTIKVRVVLTVTLDLESYRLNYGSDEVETIRKDVRALVADSCRSGGVLGDSIVDAEVK